MRSGEPSEAARSKTDLVVFIVRQYGIHLDSNKAAGFICPCTCNIAHSVTTATEDQSWEIEAAHVVNAVCVTAHTQVKATQTIARQRVTAALKNDGFRLVILHHGLDDGFKNCRVCLVGNTVAKREIHGIVLAYTDTDVTKLASAGEVLPVLVE